MDFRLRKLFVALCVCVANASGQDFPRLTLFTGYSYMHGLPTSDTVSLNGWATELTFNFTRRLGLAANFSGNYGSSSEITAAFNFVPPQSGSSVVNVPTVTMGRTRVRAVNHALIFGPEFRILQNRRTAVSLTGGIGAARSTLNSYLVFSTSGQAEPLPRSSGFTAGGGVNADIRVTEHIAYRAIQFRFINGNFDFSWQRSLQLATGLVVNLTK